MDTTARDPAYRWVIVAAGGLMGCAAMGALFALPVLLNAITTDTGWSRTGVSFAMTLAFLAMAGTSLPWGVASDRYGTRPVVLAGAVIFSGGMALAALSPPSGCSRRSSASSSAAPSWPSWPRSWPT